MLDIGRWHGMINAYMNYNVGILWLVVMISVPAYITLASAESCWNELAGEKKVDTTTKYDWSTGEVPGNCEQSSRGSSVKCSPDGFYCKPELTLKKGAGIPYATCSGSCTTWTKMEYKYDVYQKFYQKYCYCPKTGPYKVGDPYPGDKENRLKEGYPKPRGRLIQKTKPGQDPVYLVPSIPTCGFLLQNTSTKHKILIDNTMSGLIVSLQWLNNSSNLNTILYSPNGSKIDPSSVVGTVISDYVKNAEYEYYTLNTQEFGVWTMEISATNMSTNGEIYSITVRPIGDITFTLSTNNNYYLPKEQVNIVGQLAYKNTPINCALVTAEIVRPDDTIDKITLFNDDLHNGNYSGTYKNIDQEGIYSIIAQAQGTTSDGNTFKTGDDLIVQTSSSEFTGYYTDHRISDKTRYNLAIDIGINAIVDGIYYIQGKLCGVEGSEIAFSSNNITLRAGRQIVTLNFSGKEIQRNGIDGPYHLRSLYLFDKNWKMLDNIQDAYITQMYNPNDFQPLLADLTGIYSDHGEDIDKDGLYDYLTIDVGVNVATPGNYSIDGYLEDVNGNEIAWTIGSSRLNAGNYTIPLDFKGETIRKHEINGPYNLTYLTLLSGSSESSIDACDAELEPYRTTVYEFTDFDNHAS